MKKIIDTIGIKIKFIFLSAPIPLSTTKKVKNKTKTKHKILSHTKRYPNKLESPANIDAQKITDTKTKIKLSTFDFSIISDIFFPFKRNKENTQKNKIHAKKIYKYEIAPNRAKNTKISFPLANPEPTTKPKTTKIAEKIFFTIKYI